MMRLLFGRGNNLVDLVAVSSSAILYSRGLWVAGVLNAILFAVVSLIGHAALAKARGEA